MAIDGAVRFHTAINHELGFRLVNALMLDFQSSSHQTACAAQAQPFVALQQSQELLKALKAVGQAPLVLPGPEATIVTRRRLAGGLPLAMVNRFAPDQPKHLLDRLSQSGLSRTPVILAPERPCPMLADLGALPLVTPAHVALLALSPCQDTQRARLHQKWRNRLNQAQKQAKNTGLRITRQTMPQDPRHWLFDADAAQQRQRGYRSWPLALTLAYGAQNPGQAKLFQVFEEKTALAAILLLRHGAGATYHISHSTDRGKALSAHNLLLWEAMTWAAKSGCLHLDLGVINTEEAPGLARFKLGTGARLHQLGGTWLYHRPLRRLFAPLARLERGKMASS